MTPTQHRAEAERLLEAAAIGGLNPEIRTALATRALAHAAMAALPEETK